MSNPKYLVRPHDFHIFELDESTGAYRSYTSRDVTDSNGERPQAYDHFTFICLTKCGFFPIEQHEIAYFERMGRDRSEFESWQSRPDGHDGCQGGTWEEFFEYRKRKFMKELTDKMVSHLTKEEDEVLVRKMTATFDLDIND